MLSRLAPETASPEIEPQPGGFMWAHVVREPESQMTEPPRYGMHITRTIDFDFVVSGRQQCILDEEVVELEAGDCIVLKGANHAWRNVSDEPSAMLYLLHSSHGGMTMAETTTEAATCPVFPLERDPDRPLDPSPEIDRLVSECPVSRVRTWAGDEVVADLALRRPARGAQPPRRLLG